MIKQSQEIYADSTNEFNIIMPDPDYIIKETDILVLFGPDEKINESNHW